jgi:hypothetical protein
MARVRAMSQESLRRMEFIGARILWIVANVSQIRKRN